jgi:hypothetical protein
MTQRRVPLVPCSFFLMPGATAADATDWMPEIKPRQGGPQGRAVRREAGPAKRAGTDLAGIGEAI